MNSSVALKNGWYPENDGAAAWRVHSIGLVTQGGRAYVIAVLTRSRQALGMAYGQDSIAGVAGRMAHSILGP